MENFLLKEQLKNWIERLVLLPVRLRCRARSRPKSKARALALETTRNTLRSATQLNSGNLKTVFNVGMYLLLLDQDLAFFTDDLVCAIGDRRRAFIAKHEAVLLYEAAEDLPQLLGREFRNAVKAVGASEDLLDRLNSVSSDFNTFWQTHREFLGTLRKTLAAHRDHDALLYSESLQLLKPLEVMARAADLSELINRLVGILIELTRLTANPTNILRDMMASSKKSNVV